MTAKASTISTLVAVDAGVDEDRVRELLGEMPALEVAALVEGLEESWTALGGSATDAVVLACEPDSERALWFIRETARAHPDRPIVVLCAGTPNGLVRRAFEAGAEDVVMLPSTFGDETGPAAEQLGFALEKAVARRNGATSSGSSALASLICVLGPKGGIGKTLTSANLSVALASLGKRVVVADLDLQFGDVGLSLGLTPERTIYDLVKSGGSLDAEKIEAYLTRHPSGARVLMAPVRPAQAGVVTVDFLQNIYPLLRAANDFVVVDTPPGFMPEVIASIDASTHVCLVGMLDSLSLKNTKLGLETLELMGYERDRIRMVLNRADTKVGVTQEDVNAIVGRPADVLIPSHRDIVRSVNEGAPVVLSRPRSEAAKAFRALASFYVDEPAESKRMARKLRRKR
jgi:pilus assembly protein CpaE